MKKIKFTQLKDGARVYFGRFCAIIIQMTEINIIVGFGTEIIQCSYAIQTSRSIRKNLIRALSKTLSRVQFSNTAYDLARRQELWWLLERVKNNEMVGI